MDNELQMGAQGQLVIPAQLQKALGLKPGDRFIARQSGDRLVLECPESIKQRLKARFKHLPEHIGLADELLEDRRRESRATPNAR